LVDLRFVTDDSRSAHERLWADDAFRDDVRIRLDAVISADDAVEPATEMWRYAFGAADRYLFAWALWLMWGAITDEFTRPRGDDATGIRLSRQAASDLRDVIGDAERERNVCDDWIYERLGTQRRK
jgi:hypothetical protein